MHYEPVLPTRVPFIYTGTERYIRLTETFRKTDQPSINRCLILDEQLSIVSKRTKQSINLEPSEENKQEKDDCQLPKISYTVQKQPKPILFSKQYEKYPQLSDFQIGRDFWGRSQNCLKIANDHISRYHTKVQYKSQIVKQHKQRLNSILNLIVSKARCSSNWRKFPKSILELIIDYGAIAPYYIVQDCDSRNGTFMIDFGKEDPLQKGEVYQFQSQQYKVEILDVLVESGRQIAERLQQFEERQVSYELSCHKKIIASGMDNMEGFLSMEKLHVIHFQIVYPHHLTYFFWIVNAGQDQEYFIGEGQEIKVNASGENQQYEVNRHGSIAFQNGKWLIQPINPTERVWHKLKPNIEYRLDTRHRYKLGIGHHTALDLQFFNYFP